MSDDKPNSPLDQSLTAALPQATPVSMSAIDPRDRMSIQLLSRGHATVDEIMQASFGHWPPRGLDIARPNNSRIDFVSLPTLMEGQGLTYSPESSTPMGRATTDGPRHMFLDPDRTDAAAGLLGEHQLSNVAGHEGVHIIQGDHHARAQDRFGAAGAQSILAARDRPVSMLLADTVFGRHMDVMQVRMATMLDGMNIPYATDGREVQARIHQIMATGYPQWGRFPQNPEEFLVAMHGAGVNLSEDTMTRLRASPSYEETRRNFPSAPSPIAAEINQSRSILTETGKHMFERDTLPRMYADMLEMYGDRLGRERFGYGPNEYEQLRQARSGADAGTARPAITANVPDFQFKPMPDGSVGIDMSQFRNRQYDAMLAGLAERGIQYRTIDPGGRDERIIVAQADLDKLNDLKRHALTVSDKDSLRRADQRFLNDIQITQHRYDNLIVLDDMPPRKIEALVDFLKRNDIHFEEDNIATQSRLRLSEHAMGQFQAARAEVQLARSITADPTSPEYHLHAARAATSRQLLDPDYKPVPIAAPAAIHADLDLDLSTQPVRAAAPGPAQPLDLDLRTQPGLKPPDVDPRDRMAMQLLSRGHATVDEVLHASYGVWPPRGLDIIGANSQRLNFVSLPEIMGTNNADVIARASNARGKANTSGERQIWLNDSLINPSTGLLDGRPLSTVQGHEGLHIMQGDHYQRVQDAFGTRIGGMLSQAREGNVSSLLMDSLMGRHVDQARMAASPVVNFDYLRDGKEVEARVHQVTADGYPHWGQAPANREQFLIALHNNGLNLSPSTLEELKRSPTYEENSRIFRALPPGQDTNIRKVNANLNFISDVLTDSGRRVYENQTLPRMYANIIEMYGDRLGRERFGFGTNEFAQARLARAGEIELRTPGGAFSRMMGNTPVPDFSFNARRDGAVDIPLRTMDDGDAVRLRRAMEAAGIPFKEDGAGTRNPRLVIENAHLQTLTDLKQHALLHSGSDAAGNPSRRFVTDLSITQGRDGNSHIFVDRLTTAQLSELRQELKRENIPFKVDIDGSSRMLTMTDAEARRFEARQAEIRLARPAFLSPVSAEYHLEMARANAQRQLSDPSYTYKPPPKPEIDVPAPTPQEIARMNAFAEDRRVEREAAARQQGSGQPIATAPLAPVAPPLAPVLPPPPAATHVDVDLSQPHTTAMPPPVPATVPPPAPVPAPPPPVIAQTPPPPARPATVPLDLDLSQPHGATATPAARVQTPPPPPPPPPPVAVKPPPAPVPVDIDLNAPHPSGSAGYRATGGKVDQHAGRAGTAVRAVEHLAQGDVTGAVAGVAEEVATTAAIRTGVRFAAQRIPVAGAIVTAGMTLWTSGAQAVQGNYGRAVSELGAGAVESVGNIVGFGAGDALRETFRAAVVATAGNKYAPEKSGVRQIVETSVDLGNNAILASRYGSMNKKDLGAAILKDTTLPDTAKLNGKEVSLLVALEDKTFRDNLMKNLLAAAAKGNDMSAQIAMIKAYDQKFEMPIYQFTNMSKSSLEKALIADKILPDTVKLGGKEVSLIVALNDKDFRAAFIKNMSDMAAQGQDVAQQVAMLKAYDSKLKPVTPVAASTEYNPMNNII